MKVQISNATLQLASFLPPGGMAVVRSGPEGVCFVDVKEDASISGVGWVPAVFGENEQDRVKDVTGEIHSCHWIGLWEIDGDPSPPPQKAGATLSSEDYALD